MLPSAYLTNLLYFHYARCSAAHPGWRAYLLPRLRRILERHAFDGFYDDLGYRPLHGIQRPEQDISPEPESPDHDAALEDLLSIIYDMVKRRGGVFKIHCGGSGVRSFRLRVYDYLWVGEAVTGFDKLRENTKDYMPYVVPCPDLRITPLESEDELYIHSIPYCQFPLRIDGRPVTGERVAVPGLDYMPIKDDLVGQHMHRIRQYYREHPDGPYSYGWWDSCPGRADARRVWLKYLDLYRPMVREGTSAWLEIRQSDLFEKRPASDLVTSLFVNERTYLILANYGHSELHCRTTGDWRDRLSA